MVGFLAQPFGACRWLVLAAVAWTASVQAAEPPGKGITGIYTCTDGKGRRLTADRPIPECAAKEQQVLNSDGSLKAIHPPTLTAEERAAQEARDRTAAEARASQADAVRRDRNLVARYPTEASHSRARDAAMDTVLLAMKATDVRLRELAADRRPLRDEAEFYQGKTLPPKLKSAIDANDAAADAQRLAQANQEAELERINKLYDAELDRLRKLWAGVPAGSLGPLAAGAPVAPAVPATVPGPPASTAPRAASATPKR